ncbi:phage terminase small subunit [Alkanindiges illinoisensis]|uniref:Terminase n=1 Tax=Alkanindiges illinoisensis TaxID=197183 RepID=A0A4Y7X9T4_9GAMM|nr:phage terminase small subunit [Alkanindiges illinoisensis]TEU24696.1 terminase [Alkanindiges illinoisensis]
MNLARQHFQKHAAKAAASLATDFGSMQNLNAYELQLLQLNNDRARLKQIQSTEGKVKLKQALLPAYMPYVEGILEANTGVQDDILMTILVWCIDIGDYTIALKLAEYALQHNLTMPERFSRTTATLITENISNEFLKVLKMDEPVDLAILHHLAELVLHSDLPLAVVDMPDQVKAKLYLALGKATIQQIADDTVSPHIVLEAQSYLSRALALDDKCGGKTDLNNVVKLIARLTPAANDDAPPPAS